MRRLIQKEFAKEGSRREQDTHRHMIYTRNFGESVAEVNLLYDLSSPLRMYTCWVDSANLYYVSPVLKGQFHSSLKYVLHHWRV